MARVTWRGVTLDARTRDMLAEVARNTPKDLYVKPTQGSYSGSVSASAGTHDGGGAVDLAAAQLTPEQRRTLVREMRRVGFAAWLRTPAQSNWPYHIHGIAIGAPDLSSGAQKQVRDYKANRNGLASGAPDDGPRDWVNTTWETYQKEQRDMALSDEDVQRIARAAAREVWRFRDTKTGRAAGAMLRHIFRSAGGTDRPENVSPSR